MLAGPAVSEVQAGVQALGYGADTASQQITFTALVQRRVLGLRRWYFLETQAANLVTVAGTSAVPVTTADLLHIHAVRQAQGTNYPDLDPMELQQLRSLRHQDRTPSTPYAWAQANGTIELYPIPDKVYALTVDYSKHPTAPTTGADLLVIPSAYINVLVFGVAEMLAFRQRDWNAVAGFKGEYKEAIKEMIGAENIKQRQASDTIGSSDFWQNASR